MKIYGLIPARLNSSRLPGKALIKIHGLPMIIHVALRSKLATGLDKVIVCTDSPQIAEVCDSYDVNVCLTSSYHVNGTERIAQASKFLGLSKEDVVIDIQGDEPLVEPSTIDKVIHETIKCRDRGGDIFLPHLNKCSPENKNIVKVVESNGRVIYLSRLDIPFSFSDTTSLKKHLSIVGFTYEALIKFSNLRVGKLEKIEGVELLRALENDMKIYTDTFDGDSISVDVKNDLEVVSRKMMLCPIARKICGYE